jgi:TM2 domain-containing membrane protein YozV
MKRLFILLVVLFGAISVASAQYYAPQQNLVDVIYTTNGLVLQGTIVEQIPGVEYTIVTTDGRTLTIDALSVKRITKENGSGYLGNAYNYNAFAPYKIDADGNPIYPLSVAGAFTRSLIIPGLGQMYNGEGLKGGLLFTGVLVGVLGATVGVNMIDYKYEDAIGIPSVALAVGCYLYSIIDAPMTAARWNKRHGFMGGGYCLNLSPAVGTVRGNAGNETAVGMSLSLSF